MIWRNLVFWALGEVPLDAVVVITRVYTRLRIVDAFDLDDLLWNCALQFDFTAPEPGRLNLPLRINAGHCNGLRGYMLPEPLTLTRQRDASCQFRSLQGFTLPQSGGDTGGFMEVRVTLQGVVFAGGGDSSGGGGGGLRRQRLKPVYAQVQA